MIRRDIRTEVPHGSREVRTTSGCWRCRLQSRTSSVLEAPRGGSTSFSEKRKERRYPTNDAVEVRILPDGKPIPATVVDVSKSGLRLELVTSLATHARIEILMASSKLAIFGEVRYCRRSGAVFHSGVLTEDVVYSKPETGEHLREDEIALYVVGKGLTVAEVLRVQDHLSKCPACKRLMVQTTKTLYPTPRRLPPRHECP